MIAIIILMYTIADIPMNKIFSKTKFYFGMVLLFTLSLPGQDNMEGSIESFLGKPVLDLKKVFEGERFPNIVVSKKGTLIVTWGNKSVRCRRSQDGGETWGPEIVISDPGFQGGGTTVDDVTGDILAFIETHHPPAPIIVFRSKDDGKTWQKQESKFLPDTKGNLASMHMNDHGITLKFGKNKGRLIRPSRYYGKRNSREEWPNHYTNAVFSDDRGITWKASAPFPENGTGEACIVELSNGNLYYNSRIHWHERPQNTRRRSAISKDGGETWVDWDIVEILPDGHQHRSYGCMGGLVRLPVKGKDILIFSNIDTPNSRREKGTVWASFDGGKTWPVKRLVFDGPSGYSAMYAGRPGTPSEGWIYVHFEGGPNGGATVARFNLAWILDGVSTGDGFIPQKF